MDHVRLEVLKQTAADKLGFNNAYKSVEVIQTLRMDQRRFKTTKISQSLLTKHRCGGHSPSKTPPALSPPCGLAAHFGAAEPWSVSGSTPHDCSPPPSTHTGTANT